MSQEFQKQLETILNTALGIFQIIATFLIAFLVLLWLTLCVWTFRDIQSRTRDVVAQVFATLLVIFFNIPGVLLYILVRPKETLVQSYERSLQEEYMLQDLEEREICPTCRVKTQPDFMFCFNCRTRLRRECPSCGSLVKIKWASCPFCGTPQKARPRDAAADRAGLGAPRTSRPRSTPQPVGTSLAVATDEEQTNLSPAYQPPENAYIAAQPAPTTGPQPYADAGQDYDYPPGDSQYPAYGSEADHTAFKPKTTPPQINGNDTTRPPAPSTDQYEQPTGRYRPPRQRRNQSTDPDGDNQ